MAKTAKEEELKAKIAALQRELAKRDKTINKLRADNGALQKENTALLLGKQSLAETNQYILDSLELILPENDVVKYKGIESAPEQFAFLADMVVKLIKFKHKLTEFVFRRTQSSSKDEEPQSAGSADDGSGKSAAEIEQEFKDKKAAAVSKKKRRSDVQMLGKHLTEASKRMRRLKGTLNPVFNAAAGSGEHLDISKSCSNEKNPSRGRRRRKDDHLPVIKDTRVKNRSDFDGKWECPQCGAPNIAAFSAECREFLDSAASCGLLEEHNGAYKIASPTYKLTCGCCSFTDLVFSDNPPILPGRSLSLSIVVNIAIMYTMGVAVNASKSLMLKAMGLGSSTLYDNINILGFLLIPLENLIIEELKNSEEVLMDETKARVIDSEGSHTRYIPIACSPSYAKRPVLLLGGADLRSKTYDFAKGLTEGSGIDVITSDGYATYDLICEERGIAHQRCLIHLLREFVDALLIIKNTGGEFEKLCLKRLEEVFERGSFNPNDPVETAIIFSLIIAKLSYICELESFAWQEHVEKGLPLYAARKMIRTRYSKPVMDDIDVLMNVLKDTYAYQKTENGKWYGKGSEQFKGAVVYYLNGRDEYRTFLINFNAQVSSQDAEHAAKVVARARNASLYTRTDESSKTCCRIMSCIHTLNRSGVQDIPGAIHEIASFVMEEGIRQERIRLFREEPEALNSRIDYAQRRLYENIKLPEHLYPWNMPDRRSPFKKRKG